MALNTCREGASTASLGNLFQCFTALIVNNFFLISSLNLPSFSLKPLLPVLSLHALVKSPSPALNPFSAQPVFVLGIAPSCMHDPALGLVERHDIRMGPPLKPVQVPLNGIPSLQRVSHFAQLAVVSKFAEGTLNPTVHFALKDIKQSQSQF